MNWEREPREPGQFVVGAFRGLEWILFLPVGAITYYGLGFCLGFVAMIVDWDLDSLRPWMLGGAMLAGAATLNRWRLFSLIPTFLWLVAVDYWMMHGRMVSMSNFGFFASQMALKNLPAILMVVWTILCFDVWRHVRKRREGWEE